MVIKGQSLCHSDNAHLLSLHCSVHCFGICALSVSYHLTICACFAFSFGRTCRGTVVLAYITLSNFDSQFSIIGVLLWRFSCCLTRNGGVISYARSICVYRFFHPPSYLFPFLFL